jgi:AsmA-like protein
MKPLRRIVVAVVGMVLILGLLAPFWRADRLRPRIQAALQAELNRPVHIGAVHLNLFTGPGFTVDDVLIDDDPTAGIEPFAHVETLRARVRLARLLHRKLTFSSLRLEAPSVNLVKTQAGPWNIQAMLDRSAGASHRNGVPDIQIRDGRLNFKFGDTKSIFYISSADVDVYPNERGDVVIRFSGAPARTDRGTQAFGQLSARGLLRFPQNSEDQLSMGVHLERTSIYELMRLFNGRDMGVHGSAIAEAKLEGPLSRLDVSGSLNINDIHRWDLMPAKGDGWTLRYRGQLSLTNHHLELETIATEDTAPPVSVQFQLADYLSSLKWSARFLFRNLPAASLVETARHMGAPFPAGVHVDGKVEGAIGYSNDAGLDGQLVLADAEVKLPRGRTAQFDAARVSFTNNDIVLAPAGFRLDNGQSAQVEGEYALDDSRAALKITTKQLTIAEVQSNTEHVVEAPPIPLLEKLRQGTWKGWIAFARNEDHPGVWSGEYELQNAVMEIPGLAVPVRFNSASVEMNESRMQITRIRAQLGALRIEGEYRYDSKAARPHRLRLNVPEVQLAELERLMLPALRREEGFLARAFRLRKPAIPKWLQERSVEASIEVANLMNGEVALGQLRAKGVWDGTAIAFSDIECGLNEMRATGKLAIDLSRGLPSYRLSGKLENFDYRGGALDLDGELETSGIAETLLLNIRSDGTFEGRGIALAPDAQITDISGTYRVAPLSGIPRLLLSNLQVVQGADTLVGQGASQPDGRIVLELTAGRRQVRLTGMLLPIHTEPVVGR